MSPYRWKTIPLVLLTVGLACALICAIVAFREMGWWAAGVIGGIVLAAGGIYGLRHRLSPDELAIVLQKEEARELEAKAAKEQEELIATRKNVERELQAIADRVQRREQSFANRLTTYHEWMEFPRPIDLVEQATPLADEELLELAEKDRELHRMLAEESKRVFEDIRNNKYAENGVVDIDLIRDDVLDLVSRVARIYQPDSQNPLLETSIANSFRAASRACLQFLVVLEELPIDVKELNINNAYTWIRRAVQAYGIYRSTEPWWPYLSTAWYLGRFAMGANPISLGAWWVVGSLGQRGATAVAQRIVNRQALDLLNNIVRVIGYEVASVYSVDFRFRDANWIYAVELTELVSRFPVSRASLSHSLKEIGALQLRSEYNRIFLYRCLAEHKSADPARYRGYAFLRADEKAAVATRLEKFLQAFIPGGDNRMIDKWRQEVEARLEVRLKAAPSTRSSEVEQAQDAARSLASFLVSVKDVPVENLAKHLRPLSIMTLLQGDDFEATLEGIVQRAPHFLERPDLDPDGQVTEFYLNDLASLAVRTPPHSQQGDEVLMDVASWLRHDAKKMQKRLVAARRELLADLLPADTPNKRFPPEVTRAALALIGGEGQPRFLYGGVKLVEPQSQANSRQKDWLLGVDDRLILFSVEGEPRVLWRSEKNISTSRLRSIFSSALELRGGKWLDDDSTETPVLHVAGPTLMSFANYFSPLNAFAE